MMTVHASIRYPFMSEYGNHVYPPSPHCAPQLFLRRNAFLASSYPMRQVACPPYSPLPFQNSLLLGSRTMVAIGHGPFASIEYLSESSFFTRAKSEILLHFAKSFLSYASFPVTPVLLQYPRASLYVIPGPLLVLLS